LSKILCRILSVGSSEEYGRFEEKDLPLKEEHTLLPLSPYAVARVSQELLAKVYVDSYGLDIVMTRSFNHLGPGQKEIFVVSSFAKQLAEDKSSISVGELDLVRDFLDVRDVVDAYFRLLQQGVKGEIYNVCSGQGRSLREILANMIDYLKIRVDLRVDPALLRPQEIKQVIGSNDKLKKATGWVIKYPLKNSLVDMLNYWREKG
jgi:GDP-4-dehydro-6-deoxy-D-mannose reductase